jgi:hypothetical protein
MVRILIFLLALPLSLRAQVVYERNTSIPVFMTTSQLLQGPWDGGLNAVQVNTLQLNNDNIPDLVLFDRTANKVLTYVATGSGFSYSPEFEAYFPNDLINFVLLRDFNQDGKKDIFTGNAFGIKVYENVSTETQPLSWRHFKFKAPSGTESDVILTTGFSGKINLQLQFDDLPAINDVDADGDLDILVMSFSGSGTIEFHKNVSTTVAVPEFTRVTQQYGNVTECGCGVFAFNGESCVTNGRTKHAGGKALLVMDTDGNGATDLIFSESACDKVYALKNTGTSDNPVFLQAEVFPTGFQSNGLYPVPFFEDLDGDDKRDLLISPGVYTRSDEETSFNASMHLYKNTGSTSNPLVSFTQPDFLQNTMIDVGENAVPAFFDNDGDGDLDLFVGSLGAKRPSGNFIGSIYLFENIGSTSQPSFQLITTDFHNLSTHALYNIRPQFADITGDGIQDLVCSGTDTNQKTSLYYIRNTSPTSLDLTDLVINTSISLFFNENAYVTEINGDGNRDLLLGRSTGAVEYWKGLGTAIPSWQLENSAFLGIGVSTARQNPSITIGDFDVDGKNDLLLGDQAGIIHVLADFKSRTSFTDAYSDWLLNPLTQQFSSQNLGGRVWPVLAELSSSNNPYLIVGNTLGGLQVFTSRTVKTQLEIFPNPLSPPTKLSVQTNSSGVLIGYDTLGKQVFAYSVLRGINSLSLPIMDAGVYLLRFTTNGQTTVRRIVIL